MRLTRNTSPDGRCKYALVRLDKLRAMVEPPLSVLEDLENLGILEYGEKGSENEFFAIKLKDENAPTAFIAYAGAAASTDPELASDVHELAKRAQIHPSRKLPD